MLHIQLFWIDHTFTLIAQQYAPISVTSIATYDSREGGWEFYFTGSPSAERLNIKP